MIIPTPNRLSLLAGLFLSTGVSASSPALGQAPASAEMRLAAYLVCQPGAMQFRVTQALAGAELWHSQQQVRRDSPECSARAQGLTPPALLVQEPILTGAGASPAQLRLTLREMVIARTRLVLAADSWAGQRPVEAVLSAAHHNGIAAFACALVDQVLRQQVAAGSSQEPGFMVNGSFVTADQFAARVCLAEVIGNVPGMNALLSIVKPTGKQLGDALAQACAQNPEAVGAYVHPCPEGPAHHAAGAASLAEQGQERGRDEGR